MTPIIIDFETLSTNPLNGVVLNIAAMKVDLNKSFHELQENAFFVRFDIESQLKSGKKIMKSTLDWWAKQPKDIREKSLNHSDGLTPLEFCEKFSAFVKEIEPDKKKVMLVCRGSSFDIQFLNALYMQSYNTEDIFELVPHCFWNELDVRSFIKGIMMSWDVARVPISNKLLVGFEQHNAIHDVAKDVILIKQALLYAQGIEEIPTTDFTMV